MELHTQTILFMICMAYLVMHAAIWFALSEQRSTQVRLWCISGIISGISVVCLSMRGVVSEFMFIYVGQLLMILGNMGRAIALRMYIPKPLKNALIFYTFSGVVYFIVITSWLEINKPIQQSISLFFGFYTFICLDYFFVGYALYKKSQTLGPRPVMIAGLTFSLSLGFKTLWVMLGLGAQSPYEPGLDQYVMMVGQFVGITLSSIGFLRIFLERRENMKLETERNLAAAEGKAGLLAQHKNELQNLLTEREEIIRQLTLSNKTAGMGALVASLAHELNQPLCAIRLNAQLVERQLEEKDIDTLAAKKFLDSVIDDNRRAANIIKKLRSMFGSQSEQHASIDFDQLVEDTVSLVIPNAKSRQIDLRIDLQANSVITGDHTQLQQVILNLLNNAVEAFSELVIGNKFITVKTHTINNNIVLTVTDNGIGIPEELRPSIFELFKTTKAHGMGIGLWLSKAVVSAHHGEIKFSSSPAGGTCFEVNLPSN